MTLPALFHQSVEGKFINYECELPYGVRVDEIVRTVNKVYDFLYDMDSFLLDRGYSTFYNLILKNTFSGVLSEVIVKTLAKISPALVRNEYTGGHPDLLPTSKGYSKGARELLAPDGMEIKTSKQKGGWQGHNTEEGWFTVFRYVVHEAGILAENPTIEFVEVMTAQLTESDWSFSGRSSTSRRTPTASILKPGLTKLRRNPVIRNPKYLVGR